VHPDPLPEPAGRLPPQARSYWRVSGLLQGLGALVIAFALAMPLGGPWRWLVLAAGVGVLAALVAVVPDVRWRRWRYEVRDHEIDIRHGTFVVRRTLVPMRRVQHVQTEAGPLQDQFGLSTVSFHTAAGATAIPALGRDEAERVRARVAVLARTLDDV
jgi:uncharacterized protein